MPLLYHAYVYLEFLILACTIYILAPPGRILVLQYRANRVCFSHLEGVERSPPLDYQKRGKTSGNHDGRAEGTFFRYTDAVHEHQTMVECLLFQSSFKLGAKMMVEVME